LSNKDGQVESLLLEMKQTSAYMLTSEALMIRGMDVSLPECMPRASVTALEFGAPSWLKGYRGKTQLTFVPLPSVCHTR
jgi:hypothetical protein